MSVLHSPKAREREFVAKASENRRAIGLLNPMRFKTEDNHQRGEELTPVITVCPEDHLSIEN